MTNRENILKSLELDLRAIRRPAYKTDVACVEPFVRDECVGRELRPWIGFAPAQAPFPIPEYFGTSQCFSTTLFVVVQLLIAEVPGSRKRQCLNDLIDDVIGAVHSNIRRKLPDAPTVPNAKNTRLVQDAVTDEMDPDWLRTGVGEAVMVFAIEYNRPTTHESPTV